MKRNEIARRVGLLVACAAAVACGKPKAVSGTAAAELAAPAPAAARAAAPGASCDQCRATMCGPTSSVGVDLVAGCFVKPDPKIVPNPGADFTRDCKAVLECAYKHACAYDPATGPVHCYCGSRLVDECLAEGPAPDAPCVEEWRAATRGATNGEVLERFSLSEYPSGWAFNLLECDRDRCGEKSAIGRCTP